MNNVLETIVNTKSILDNCEFSNINNIIRIIDTIISGLEMHGFMKIHWLEDMTNNAYDIDLESTYKIVCDLRIK
jgi:hypothetical protein